MAAATLFQSMTGVLARAKPSSELLMFPESILCDGRVLLVASSRSGTTSETLKIVKDFKEMDRGDVIVVTNYSSSPLALMGDISIAIDKGQEKSVAQTRSFASMYMALSAIAHKMGRNGDFSDNKDRLISVGNALIKNYDDLAKTTSEDRSVKQVFYLGSGARYGLAHEVSLKLKEMSQTVTEAYHFFEFRHGPISLIDKDALVVGLVSEQAFDLEKAVMGEVAELGARTITIGESNTDIAFNSQIPESARGVLYLPVLQLLAYYRALFLNKNPDGPRNITSVVELDLHD
jgi:glucosamine--fructose-6-phosphate aminotransferase (isomerizing)